MFEKELQHFENFSLHLNGVLLDYSGYDWLLYSSELSSSGTTGSYDASSNGLINCYKLSK